MSELHAVPMSVGNPTSRPYIAERHQGAAVVTGSSTSPTRCTATYRPILAALVVRLLLNTTPSGSVGISWRQGLQPERVLNLCNLNVHPCHYTPILAALFLFTYSSENFEWRFRQRVAAETSAKAQLKLPFENDSPECVSLPLSIPAALLLFTLPTPLTAVRQPTHLPPSCPRYASTEMSPLGATACREACRAERVEGGRVRGPREEGGVPGR